MALKNAAKDPAIIAELLLLFRMILADGKVKESELTMFRRICREQFGLDDGGFDATMRFIGESGDGISNARTVAVFRDFERERRVALARNVAELARADDELNRYEERLLLRVLDILDLEPADIAEQD